MSFWDKLFGEFVDVIEWTQDSGDTMVYRFERYGNEIKYGAKLTVREGQVAVFVNEGRVADVFQPGMYELETNNVPILSTLQNWPSGFESPFKAEVYFFSKQRFIDLKWGTKNPIMLRDSEFGAVRLRAFGTYEVRIDDAVIFLREVVGTDGHFTTNEITNQLRNLIVSRFANVVGESDIPVLDLAGNYEQLGTFITGKIAPEFKEYGLELTRMLVENISLPSDVEKALDKRTSMGMVGDLSKYASYQAAEALTTAAANPGGGAGDGVGLGMGIAMAHRMSETLGAPAGGATAQNTGAPPPLPSEAKFYLAANGHQTGPFTKAEMRAKIEAGEVSRDSLMWTTGLSEWTDAGDLPDMASLFKDQPPPLPGA
ncbi:MAG: SPFH domain-containing protein [Pseudomonadota bacterium]